MSLIKKRSRFQLLNNYFIKLTKAVTAGVLYKKLFVKTYRNIHRKTAVLKSFLNKVAGGKACKACNLIKSDSAQMFSCKYYKISASTCLEEHLRMVASEVTLKGRIRCEIFLSEHFMKYSFRVIS